MIRERRLILIRHSQPQIDETRPAAEWRLSVEGRRRCLLLAERLRALVPVRLVASHEPKASETAALVAQQLGIPWTSADGLHEHLRQTVGYLDPLAWRQAIAALFAHPDQLVLGEETAAQALARFAAAVDAALSHEATETLAIVAHGTVISLYAGLRSGCDAHALWASLGLPAMVMLSLPSGELTIVAAHVE